MFNDFLDIPVNRADTQMFQGAGGPKYTWRRPRNDGMCFIVLVGGGAGGGGGCTGATSTIRCGGGGGGASAVATLYVPLMFLPDTLYISLGAGGAGGGPGATGVTGTSGALSRIDCTRDASQNAATLLLISGNAAAVGGTGGSTSTGAGGTGGTIPTLASNPMPWNAMGFFQGYAGIAGSTSAATTGAAGTALPTTATHPYAIGGGGGASTTAANGDFAPGGSTGLTDVWPVYTSGGVAGGNPGAGGVLGFQGRWVPMGGSGGGASGAGTAGKGGEGAPGCGGGGGGGGITGGSGGRGGDGYCLIVCW